MIPFVDFKAQYFRIKEEIDAAVSRVLDSGWYILGNEVKEFECEFAKFIGSKYAVGVASGTEAIVLALMAVGVKAGDEVITTDMTAYPTITAIVQLGAIPVLVDIRIDDGLIDVSLIEKSITEKTRAIVPVHLYGQSCDMDLLMTTAKKFDIHVVEDCAQSVGATYKNHVTGTIGSCGAFSFYPTKNLGAYGDAGAVTTNDEVLYKKLLAYRNYGQSEKYVHDMPGINSRLDEIQAAVLRVKLKYLSKDNEIRREIAKRYQDSITTGIFLSERDYGNPVYHLFVLKINERDRFVKHMTENGVSTLIHFPFPIHEQKAFVWKIRNDFSDASKFAQEVVSIPIYPEMTSVQIEKIITVVNSFS